MNRNADQFHSVPPWLSSFVGSTMQHSSTQSGVVLVCLTHALLRRPLRLKQQHARSSVQSRTQTARDDITHCDLWQPQHLIFLNAMLSLSLSRSLFFFSCEMFANPILHNILVLFFLVVVVLVCVSCVVCGRGAGTGGVVMFGVFGVSSESAFWGVSMQSSAFRGNMAFIALSTC